MSNSLCPNNICPVVVHVQMIYGQW